MRHNVTPLPVASVDQNVEVGTVKKCCVRLTNIEEVDVQFARLAYRWRGVVIRRGSRINRLSQLFVAPLVVVLPDVPGFDLPAVWIVGGEGETATLEALPKHVLPLAPNRYIHPVRLSDWETGREERVFKQVVLSELAVLIDFATRIHKLPEHGGNHMAGIRNVMLGCYAMLGQPVVISNVPELINRLRDSVSAQ